MSNNRIEGIIFDLDGVITDSAKYHYQAWKLLADKLNIPFDEEYNENLKGVSRMASLELILKNGNAQDKYTLEQKEEMCFEKNENYKELIKQITPDDILPGILPFIKQIKNKGIKTAIASVSRNAQFILRQLKVMEYFDYICNAAEISKSKPDPEIFLVAAKNIGAKPENCIGIEDAEAGVEAINAAGMFSVGVGTQDKMHNANMILSGTNELDLEAIAKASGLNI
ncbi:MAG: beta-phosphoglucomutase [Christensenellaceae bacterium]|nr:beta-phosphoglucomutase [Christensenellaceae bacterium]